MNVLKALIAVMIMQLATTLKGVIPALVTVDTQAMGFLAQVSVTIQSIYILHSDIATMEVAISLVPRLSLGTRLGCHHNCHNSVGSYT